MLSKERAIQYYKSLHFNHFKSGGTCEQRVLVLRARFDRILEEVSVHDFDSQSLYVEKLQQVFSALPKKFKKKEQNECHALRKYLNGIQHSTFEADESQYLLSLKRLCNIIYLLSGENIPQELLDVWSIKQVNSVSTNKAHNEKTFIAKDDVVQNVCINNEVPAILCVDCSFLQHNDALRKHFNELIINLIKEIGDNNLNVNLQLILLEKNKVKYVQPLLGKTSYVSFQKLNSEVVDSLIDNSLLFFKTRYTYFEQHEINNQSPSWLITMFTSHVTKLLSNNKEIKELSKEKNLIVLPIGMEKGMDPKSFQSICNNRETMILSNKYEEFFYWLLDCFKNVCNSRT